jgi:predicted RNA binding protein YcfA (HicA-like mRNA interferase family)
MLKSISRRNLIKRFRNLGFDGPYSGGRHLFMIRDSLKIHIPNPHGRDVSKYLLSEILRQAGISKRDWNDLN